MGELLTETAEGVVINVRAAPRSSQCQSRTGPAGSFGARGPRAASASDRMTWPTPAARRAIARERSIKNSYRV